MKDLRTLLTDKQQEGQDVVDISTVAIGERVQFLYWLSCLIVEDGPVLVTGKIVERDDNHTGIRWFGQVHEVSNNHPVCFPPIKRILVMRPAITAVA